VGEISADPVAEVSPLIAYELCVVSQEYLLNAKPVPYHLSKLSPKKFIIIKSSI
jgi:hypothetical protein